MEILESLHLHPLFVHFPVALFIASLIFEVLAWILKKETFHSTSRHLFLLAVIMAPLAIWTGLEEAEEHHLQHPVLNLHKTFAFLTVGGAVLNLINMFVFSRFYPKQTKVIYFILLVLIALCVSLTGYFGGKLVFEYGIGMES